MRKKTNAFTLIELLLVIGIIAVLAVVVFVALNPAQRFADARNARRTSDVETILSATHQYIIDHKGTLPPGLTSGMQQLGSAGGGCELSFGACSDPGTTACLDLTGSDVLGKYLKTMPFDPSSTASAAQTHYAIQSDANGIITVTACDSENGANISVSR